MPIKSICIWFLFTGKNMAVWYCSQCAVGYCQACLGRYHPNRGPLSRHKVTQFNDADHRRAAVYCTDHAKEEALIVCDVCHVFVCHLCVCEGDGKHVNHRMLAPEAAIKQLRVNY